MLLKTIRKALTQIPNFRKVVVGVSGGVDSVALAHLLIRLGYKVVIAHLNHGLRGKESDADEALVKKLTSRWKVPCVTRKIEGQKLGKGDLENRLRTIRYGFLEKVRQRHKADFIAVAHQQDDQVETILMHLARGSGIRGLQGMTAIRGKVIRPLLHIRKTELEGYLKQNKIPFRNDSSNWDPTHRRNVFRHHLIPIMKAQWPTLEKDLLDLAKNAQIRTQKTEDEAKDWIARHHKNGSFGRREFLELSDDLRAEVLFQLSGRSDVYRKAMREALTIIRKGVTGKQKKLGNKVIRIQYGRVALYPKPAPGFLPDKPQPIAESMVWGQWKLLNRGAKGLYVRSWKPGDRFIPSGMQGSKKIQDFFVDHKIPKHERHQIPIIVNDKDRVLAVGNLRVARNAGYLKKFLRIQKI